MITELSNADILKSEYAQRNPKSARAIITVRKESRTMGTKKGYLSSLRNFVKFAKQNGVNPTSFPIDPVFIMFWIADRAETAGNIQSIDTWTASIFWWHTLCRQPKLYKYDERFTSFRRNLVKQHKKKAKQRLPFRLYHIARYTIAKKVVPGQHQKRSLDDILSVLLAQLAIFTMSRPSELVKSHHEYNNHGLLFQNLSVIKSWKEYWLLKVVRFKNQNLRSEPRDIPLASSNQNCTRKNCLCLVLNPFKLLQIYISRRQKLSKTLSSRNREKLRTTKDKPVFVKQDGREITTKDLNYIAKEIAQINNLPEKDRYGGYSFRTGGTTAASIAGIGHAKIMEYVGWSDNQLPDMASHYIQHDQMQLSTMAAEMLHTKSNDQRYDCFGLIDRDLTKVYDPWTSQARARAKKRDQRHIE